MTSLIISMRVEIRIFEDQCGDGVINIPKRWRIFAFLILVLFIPLAISKRKDLSIKILMLHYKIDDIANDFSFFRVDGRIQVIFHLLSVGDC
jgi:hypothetical protein